MPWYFYLLEFLAGAFLANGVPHFVHGISGAPFQSPFANPPGVGESSPTVNVVWGFANLLAGILLLHYFWPMNCAGWTVLAVAVLAMGLQGANHFGKVRAEKHS
jgi:uncharacterized membrane protein